MIAKIQETVDIVAKSNVKAYALSDALMDAESLVFYLQKLTSLHS